MRRTRQTSAVHIPVMAILSAVLCGCAFLVPAAGSAATITVEIIKPVDDQVVFDVGKEYDFEAVAFIEGVELPGGEVTWDWDFGDESDHASVNPTRHAYAQPGNYTITVTATYAGASLAQPQQGAVRAAAGAISGSAQLKATAEPPSFKNELKLVARNGMGEFGGVVADQVEVSLRYTPPNGYWHMGWVTFYRQLNGQWQEVGRVLPEFLSDGSQVASTYWSSDMDHNTEAVQWRAQAPFQSPPVMPDDVGIIFTASREESWTPNNVVVKSVGPDVILHHKNDPPHRIDWTVSHLVDASLGINPVFPVVVTIYDVSGNSVYTSSPIPTAPGEDGGSLVWSPTFPEGGDRNAIFTYRVSACLCCYDCDKDFDIPRPQITRCNISIDVPNMIGHFDFDYAIAGGDLDEAKAVIYDPELGEIGCQEYGLLRNGSTGTTHYTVNLSPSGPWGAFTVLLKGKQSATWAKYANRDEEVKTAIARGAVGAILPGLCTASGGGAPWWAQSTACSNTQDEVQQWSLQPNYVGWGSGDGIEEIHRNLENCALFAYYGHGNETQLGPSGPGFTTTNLRSTSVDHVRLALWFSCNSGGDTWGDDNFVDVSVASGADCSIGFGGQVLLPAAPAFASLFWNQFEVLSASEALYLAANEIDEDNWQYTGLTYYVISGDVQASPAAYGE